MAFQLNQELVDDYKSNSNSSTPIPAGEYNLVIVATEDRANAAGTGRFYKLEIEVADGQHKGRKLWEIVNYEHPNAQAVAISTRTLTGLCLAMNLQGFSHPDELRYKPFRAKVKVQEDKSGKYGPQNRLGNVVAPQESTAQQSAPQAASGPPQTNATPAAQQQGWS